MTRAEQSQQMIERLDLGTDPFIHGGASVPFFGGAERGAILEQLLHQLRFGPQALLLTGGVGSGKSRMLATLFKQIGNEVVCSVLNGQSFDGGEGFCQALADNLLVDYAPGTGVASLAMALTPALGASAGFEVDDLWLMIDDADELDASVIVAINHLSGALSCRLQVLLVCREDAVTPEGLPGGAAKRFDLPSLNAQQTGDYLMHCLKSVGYVGPQPLSQDQLAVLCEQGQGNLRHIAELAPALLSGAEEPETKAAWSIPRSHALAIALLVVALGFTLWLQSEDEPEPAEAIAAQPLDLRERLNRAEQTAAADKKKAAEQKAASTESAKTPSAEVAGNGPAQEQLKPPPAKVVQEPKPAPKVKPKAESKKAVAEALKPKAPAAKPAPIAKPVYSSAEQRLLSESSSAYRIQLLGSRSEQSARSFAAKHTSIGALYYRAELSGKPWYVVVAGPYRNKVEAQAAVARLPIELRRQQPWPRPLKDIQAQLRRR